jgi:transcriptional regulator GlxA family with amidase domain
MRLVSTLGLLFGLTIVLAAQQPAQQPPKEVRVAFVISDNFNMMDFAGPWEVFQDVMLIPPGKTMNDDHDMPYALYTVSESTSPVSSTDGAKVIPAYTFANAPKPDIVVIGAQSSNSPALMEWLRKQAADKTTLMSVCTGASKLARSHLIDGKKATTHHDAIDHFREQFPAVEWQTSKRYVRSTDNIYTAGGLTSGIDLALHLVAKRFGNEVAQATADYMEYHGDGWKQPE